MMAMMLDSVQWASIHSMLKLSSNLKKIPFTHTKKTMSIVLVIYSCSLSKVFKVLSNLKYSNSFTAHSLRRDVRRREMKEFPNKMLFQ